MVNDLASLGMLFGGALLGMTLFVILLGFAVYIYQAIALMTIARKTRTKNGWLAFIPVANLYLMTQVAKAPWWTILLFLLVFIPMIGTFVVLFVYGWWWWKIAEARKMPGWLGILMVIPVVNLVVIGYIAWAK